MILQNCDIEAGLALAEKLRRSLAEDEVLLGLASGGVTASLGVALLARDESVESLVGRADRALYAAKLSGRNRVSAAADSPRQNAQEGAKA